MSGWVREWVGERVLGTCARPCASWVWLRACLAIMRANSGLAAMLRAMPRQKSSRSSRGTTVNRHVCANVDMGGVIAQMWEGGGGCEHVNTRHQRVCVYLRWWLFVWLHSRAHKCNLNTFLWLFVCVNSRHQRALVYLRCWLLVWLHSRAKKLNELLVWLFARINSRDHGVGICIRS